MNADAEATFEAMRARLQAGIEAQRRFAANASHELRTPLAVLRSAVEVALADPEPTVESLRRMAKRVMVSIEHQERLIDRLLCLANASARQPNAAADPVDLATAAHDALETVGGATDVNLRDDLAPAWTTGDPDLLERLAANLVENAIRHNHPGGWVRVRTFTGPGSHAVLEVANSGPRVAPDAMPMLFEPFQRGRRDGQGSGLGLSIVAAIVESHNGALSAGPLDDGGLRIRVELPPGQAGG